MECQGPTPAKFLGEVLGQECAGGAVIIGSSGADRSLIARQLVGAILARRSDRRALAIVQSDEVPLWQNLRAIRPTSTYLRQEQLAIHKGVATDKKSPTWTAFEGQFPAQPEDLVLLDTVAASTYWPIEHLRLFKREYKSLIVTIENWEQLQAWHTLFDDVPKLMTRSNTSKEFADEEVLWLAHNEPDSIPILAHIPNMWKMAGAQATSFWIRQRIALEIAR